MGLVHGRIRGYTSMSVWPPIMSRLSLVGPRRPLNLEMLTIDQRKIANGYQDTQHRSHNQTPNNGFKLE